MSIVIKYGGTALGTVDGFTLVVETVKVLRQTKEKVVIVVSAIGKTTDSILHASKLARSQDSHYEQIIEQLLHTHLDFNQELQESIQSQERGEQFLQTTFQKLKSILYGVYLTNELTNKVLDHLLSFGETLAAHLLFFYLQGNVAQELQLVDSVKLIATDTNYGNAQVDFEKTRENYTLLSAEIVSAKIWVVPGFIAGDPTGNITTLGRGGSDYTAAILGFILDVDEVIIYTDVDGIMTADPRLIPQATSIPALSYKDMFQLANYGANVVYSPTIIPLYKKNIPVTIKNMFNPHFIGTTIRKEKVRHLHPLIAVNSMEICLIKLYGEGLIGRIGISGKLFSTLSLTQINVLFISQSSSEHSIHVGISPDMLEFARPNLLETFQPYLKHGFEIVFQSRVILVTIEGFFLFCINLIAIKHIHAGNLDLT